MKRFSGDAELAACHYQYHFLLPLPRRLLLSRRHIALTVDRLISCRVDGAQVSADDGRRAIEFVLASRATTYRAHADAICLRCGARRALLSPRHHQAANAAMGVVIIL